MSLCGDLLREWCGKLLELQIKDVDNPSLKGGILCPACAGIHGRCFDAIYPFLYLADVDQDSRYLEAAKLLFDWAENTVSREDGSYVNDTNSEWKGITVFSVIQLLEALEYHGRLLDEETFERWKARIAKAAEFLCGYREFEVCNVNYRITNSLAMQMCGEFLGEERYKQRAREMAGLAADQLTQDGILFGEGRPVDGFSSKGCRPVDVGYNMEESLPSLLQYACLAGDEALKKAAVNAMKRHTLFLVEDGGMDNSFGTRNYKWTYWGSRTSDGLALGWLLGAEQEPELGAAAFKNLHLLKSCTHDGFLYGGPHVHEIGEPPCVHHAFSHAKVLAGILDRGLEERLIEGTLPRMDLRKPYYLEETDTYFITRNGYTATVTGYDWEYIKLPGGHASGGTLSFLWQEKAGPVLCAGMGSYSMKEANNMQLPRFERHECITPRLEYMENGVVYSSMYDYESRLSCEPGEMADVITVTGRLSDLNQNKLSGDRGSYRIKYVFENDRITVSASAGGEVFWILPVVSGHAEAVELEERVLRIQKEKSQVRIQVLQGELELPYGVKRIYNLTPGLEAVKLRIRPSEGEIAFCFSF